MTLDPRAQTRRLSTCYRHPAEPVNGFCASCLRERLAGLDPSVQPESSSSAATAFKSILKNSGTGGRPDVGASQRDNDAASELRRSKSCSVRKCEASSGSSEPRRKSCDVRARKSLQHLFSIDDGDNGMSKRECEVESKNLGFSIVTDPVFKRCEDDERRRRVRVTDEGVSGRKNVHIDEQRVEEVEEELKTMKEHIDLELQSRKRTGRDLKDIAGSVWVAASIFSKKLQKLKLKQKTKKHSGSNGGDSNLLVKMQVEKKLNWREFRETQSEVADYGFGRRSCDTDPRFSVDAARISSDDPRFSFDDYLIARTIPRLTPMLSVVENAMMAPTKRFDNRVLVEDQMNAIIEDETTSGGSGQTRDYCSDSSSSQRRSSFDLASSGKNSTKKALALEVDEVKSVLNTKMSPSSVEIFHGTKLLITDKEFRDLNSKFLKEDQSKSFQSASKNATFVPSGGNPKGVKKSNRWQKVWNFLGSNYEGVRENVNERLLEESGEDNGVVKGDSSSSPKLIRSSSCVGSRSSSNMIGSYNNMRGATETGGCAKKIREEFVPDRHRSVRYSPSNTDNGLLRFYLTPLRSYRSKSGKVGYRTRILS